MATAVTMPKLGLTMTKGMVARWLVQDGQHVEQGQPLVVVMSAKITQEIEAPASGTMRLLAQQEETCPVGQAIGEILGRGEPVREDHSGREEADRERPFAPTSSPAARRLARELGIDIALVPGPGRGGRITESDVQSFYDAQASTPDIQATPLARRMAQEEGLDLARIAGTGPAGRVTEDDVLRVLEEKPKSRTQALPLTGIRQIIAERMLSSLHTTAQLTLTAKADVSALVELRDVLRKRWNTPVSYTDLLVKATAAALGEHPLLNSRLDGQQIVFLEHIHIGVAVALDDGLIVPVVRHADKRDLVDIHLTVRDLSERARSGTLTMDEVTGGTFTLTNLGMYGIETFTPILNPPEAAILGVGRIGEELALRQGQVLSRSVMTLSLTIDHRIVDGAPGAAFLQTLIQFLEHPALILAENRPSARKTQL
jgi:pyruvate dehydrogenase E2 component (dihydrolipoamide acetyltransferase)